MVPKKGLEPPHPCGYMDLNHARLPIPPLRQVDYMRGSLTTAFWEEQHSILQREGGVSNQSGDGIRCWVLGLRALRGALQASGSRDDAPVALPFPPNWGTTYNPNSVDPDAPGIPMPNSPKLPPDVVSRLRTLAHDLSNAIETILQASYLLGELNLEAPGKTWVTLIADAAQDAAHVNSQIRDVLRTQ